MLIKATKNKQPSSTLGFTIVEIIVVFAIIGILASFAIPSSLGWIYKEEQKAYIRQLVTFLELVRRESRRYSISCVLTPGDLNSNQITSTSSRFSQPDIPAFNVNCYGLENTKTTIYNKIPSLGKNNFQEISSVIKFSPKGQVVQSTKSGNSSSIVIVVGPKKEGLNRNEVMPKCLSIQTPSGIIFSGNYNQTYKLDLNRKSTSYNYSLIESKCIR